MYARNQLNYSNTIKMENLSNKNGGGYTAPEIEILSMQLESGFATSPEGGDFGIDGLNGNDGGEW